MPDPRRSTPHPFAWILIAALALALAAAALAPDRAPVFALYWNPIYRAEIALVVLAIVYLLVVIGWMAWNGQALRRIELPGGAALERDTQELDAAAMSLSEYKTSLDGRLGAVEAALEDVIERVDQIEDGSIPPGSRVP